MKAKKLRKLFEKQDIIRVVGAHNGLTARLVENAGFDAVWASSLEVSASHAVPDANVLTMTDYLNAAISMDDAVSIPVIVDVDQGYGNSINVIRMVKKFEAAGVAGIIMEDKKFPKQNSLLASGKQELASIAEFVGKIMAAKNAQQSKDFMVMARVEALIAGWGQEEAMKRAEAYVNAGADAIMIHSKKNTPDEIVEFINNWKINVPLVIVPTSYYSFTEKEIKKYPKIKMVIYANHVIRSAVTSIKDTLKEISQQRGVHTISEKLIPVTELFELQGTNEMKEYEKKFVRDGKEDVVAIIPAAGRHSEESLNPLLKDTPLCMLDINGKSILQRSVESLKRVGINDIYVAVGYKADKINLENIKKIKIEDFEQKGPLSSIMSLGQYMNKKTLILYSDIIFENDILSMLIKRNEDIILVIDSAYKTIKDKDKPRLDKVVGKRDPIEGDRVIRENKDNEIMKIGYKIPKEDANYEFIGMALFSKRGIELLKKYYQEAKSKLEDNDFTTLIQYMINKGVKINCFEIYKGWTEILTFDDYKRITSLLTQNE